MNILISFVLCLMPAALAGVDAAAWIVGGRDVSNPGQYPHQGSIQMYGSHSCGCSLISNEWILTAAHCMGSQPSAYTVIFGAHDLKSKTRGTPTTYKIRSISVHPMYNSGPGKHPNDIALMRLTTKVETSDYIKIIQMAPKGTSHVGETCTITGWGFLSGSTFESPDILQEAQTNIISQTECRAKWGEDKIVDGQLCVFTGVSGACQGDSGGPLVCPVNGEMILVGVTSWGHPRCSKGYPSIYTDVSYYRDWIKSWARV